MIIEKKELEPNWKGLFVVEKGCSNNRYFLTKIEGDRIISHTNTHFLILPLKQTYLCKENLSENGYTTLKLGQDKELLTYTGINYA